MHERTVLHVRNVINQIAFHSDATIKGLCGNVI